MEYVTYSGTATPVRTEDDQRLQQTRHAQIIHHFSDQELSDKSPVLYAAAMSFAGQQHRPVAERGNYSQLGRLDVLGGALDGVAVLCGELGDDLQQGGALVLHGLAVAAEEGLVLGRQHVDTGL